MNKFVYPSKLEQNVIIYKLSEMPDAPGLGIEGENNEIAGIPKRK